MPTEAQKRANYKYQESEKYKEYKRQYMKEYYLRNKEKFQKKKSNIKYIVKSAK